MDYKITCVCGHQFLLAEEQLRAGEVHCPACNQRLTPAMQTPAQPADSAPAMDAAAAPEPTKRCPFCGEVILAIARKCKHCGEFLDRAPPAPPALPADAPAALAPTATATAGSPAAGANDPVFSLYTSQWDNFWRYLTLGALVIFVTFILAFFKALQAYLLVGVPAAILFAAIIGYVVYLSARRTRILIRPLRIDIEKGLLSRSITSMELFRITDVDLHQGLIPRLLGFGTIKLSTSDTDSPELTLRQIPRAREVRQYLQTQIPLVARQRGAVFVEK